jgi:heme exporter protein D
MNLGPYASFIWASYGLAALVIGGLMVWLVRDGQRQAAALADLEARGIKRRSAE